MINKNEILAEKEVYWNSVLFFAAFSEFCKINDIPCSVESKLMGANGTPKYPDFSIFDKKRENLKIVFEHKGSLPLDINMVYESINETKDKYSILEFKSKKFSPRVIMFLPKSCEEVIKKLDKAKTKLEVIVFNLRDEEKITFLWLIKSGINDALIDRIVDSEIACNEDDFAKYKFIRKDPHPTYTAWILKNIIISRFKTPNNYNKDNFKIKLSNIYDQAETLFPSWVDTDVKQITRDRIMKALKFLKFIGFVDFSPNPEEIIVYNNKGMRTGELFEYFARKWLEYSKPKGKKGKKKVLPKGQKTLN